METDIISVKYELKMQNAFDGLTYHETMAAKYLLMGVLEAREDVGWFELKCNQSLHAEIRFNTYRTAEFVDMVFALAITDILNHLGGNDGS